MPLDPRLSLFAGQGVTPIRDPLETMGAVYQLQGQQQQQQANQLKLDAVQRQEFERQNLGQAIRGTMTTDPATGQQRPDLRAGLAKAYTTSRDPLTLFKVEQEYTQSQAESVKLGLEAQKQQLEQQGKALEFGGQVAQGVEDRIAAGADPQVAWQWGIETMRRGGFPTEGITPTYDATMLAGWKGQALALKDKLTAQQKLVDQQLAEQRLALEQQRAGFEERRTVVQEQELGVKRDDLTERRAERLQQRQTKGESRTFEQEDKLRNDFIAQTKPYQTQSDFYGRIETAAKDPSAAGDLALIYSFMKLLDPGSTVLAGEYATAANAGSIPERIYSQYNRLVSGELLGDEEKGAIRKDYIDRARRLYDQATKDYQRTKTVFEERARRYNLDPANVTQDLSTTAPREAGASARPAEAPRRYTRQQVEQKLKPGWTLDQAIEYYRSQGIEVE